MMTFCDKDDTFDTTVDIYTNAYYYTSFRFFPEREEEEDNFEDVPSFTFFLCV